MLDEVRALTIDYALPLHIVLIIMQYHTFRAPKAAVGYFSQTCTTRLDFRNVVEQVKLNLNSLRGKLLLDEVRALTIDYALPLHIVRIIMQYHTFRAPKAAVGYFSQTCTTRLDFRNVVEHVQLNLNSLRGKLMLDEVRALTIDNALPLHIVRIIMQYHTFRAPKAAVGYFSQTCKTRLDFRNGRAGITDLEFF